MCFSTLGASVLSKLKAEHKLQELIMRKMAPDIECYE